MAKGFIACDREQSFLMPPDVREWLPEDHFAWFVLDAVEAMDLDAFYAVYRVDGRARPAYEPSMIVAVLLYAYARGVRSSRRIERAVRRGHRLSGVGGADEPITRRWRGSWNATRTRWLRSSAGRWGCARTLAWLV